MKNKHETAGCLTLFFLASLAVPTATAQSIPQPPGPQDSGAASSVARPATTVAEPETAKSELEELRRQVELQRRQIESLQRAIEEQQSQTASLRRAIPSTVLETQRAAGDRPRDLYAQATGQPQPPVASPGQQQQPVGQPAEAGSSTPRVAPIFDQPGVLTPRGKAVVEPSLAYSYSSSNRLSVVGYTVIPALNIGLFDVREVKRTTWTGTLAGRYGITNRFEVEARLPYVYRHDDTISRPFGVGAGRDALFSASGQAIGDMEFAGRYQLNDGGPNKPYYIGTLRFKTRTGQDPFEVLSDPALPNTPAAAGTPGLQRELPTGSGFYGLQPGITWLFPSDPAVFFGSLSYLYSFERSNIMRNTTSGPEPLGTIRPGGIFGFNFGMGLSINDKTSLSLGYDHASIGKTRQNGQPTNLAVRTQLGTMLLGFSYRLDPKRSLNLSLGVGVTRDAPDLTLTLRVPYSL